MIRKRSVTLKGHRTSLSLEDAFWEALLDIAAERAVTPTALVAGIDAARRPTDNLSSAIRLFVLERLRQDGPPLRRAERS